MDITVTRRGALLVASGLPKLFDYTVCPDFQRALAPHLDPMPPVLILDLSGVEFMDSSAIGSLITIRKPDAAERRHPRPVFPSPRPWPRCCASRT